jgi:hypothetical protein
MPSFARELFDSLTWDTMQQWRNDEERETLHLEFKRKDAKSHAKIDDVDKANLAKALSSFANVEGGLYVIGVDAGGGLGKDYDRVKAIVPITDVTKFAGDLEKRIRTFTDPPIAGLQIRDVVPGGSGDGVVAIYVPESYGGPHRVVNATKDVNDRYFMRTAAGDQTMPHGLLADRFGRRARPELGLYSRVTLSGDETHFAFALSNSGRGPPRFAAWSARPGFVARAPEEGVRYDPTLFNPNPEHGMLLFESDANAILYPGMTVGFAHTYFNPVPSGSGWTQTLNFIAVLFALGAEPIDVRGEMEVTVRPGHCEAKPAALLLVRPAG